MPQLTVGCHGDSRVVWAGFLSWPLVKQTSKDEGQRPLLVLPASFTSSPAFSTSLFTKFISLPVGLPRSPQLSTITVNHQAVSTACCRAATSPTGLGRLSDERLLTQRSAWSPWTQGVMGQWDAECMVTQTPQVLKQGLGGLSAPLLMFMISMAVYRRV